MNHSPAINQDITRLLIVASVAGLVIGSLVQGGVSIILPTLVPETPVMPLFQLDISLGLTLGAFQYMALSCYLSRAWLWIVATGFGMATAEVVAGFVLHDVLNLAFGFHRSALPDALAALAIVGFTVGICVGGAQWLVLYREGLRAVRWMSGTIVGVTAAIAYSGPSDRGARYRVSGLPTTGGNLGVRECG
jgi:hypothetical protein